MTARLAALNGALEGESFILQGPRFSIGRLADNDLVINEKYISRHHAEILYGDGEFSLRSLSRKNPVLVNGKEVDRCGLSAGDRIQVCDYKFRFELPSETPVEGQSQRKPEKPVPPSEQHRVTDTYSADAFQAAIGSGGPVVFGGEKSGSEEEEEPIVFGDAGGSPDRTVLDGAQDPLELSEGPSDAIVFGEENSDPDVDNILTESALTDEASAFESGEDEGGIVFGETDDDIDVDLAASDPVDEEESAEQTSFVDMGKLVQEQDVSQEEELEKELQKPILYVSGAGIVIALVVILQILLSFEPQVYRQERLEIHIGENVRLEDQWPSGSPVQAIRIGEWREPPGSLPGLTPSSTRASTDILTLRWIRPTSPNISYLIVSGKEAGRTTLHVLYENGDRSVYPVKIQGQMRRALEKEEFINEMKSRPLSQRYAAAAEAIRRGDRYREQRERVDKESFYYLSIQEYKKAMTILSLVEKDLEGFDQKYLDLFEEASEKLEEAKEEWNTIVDQTYQQFRDFYGRDKEVALRRLERLLKLINDRNDVRYIRMQIFRETMFED